MSIKKVNKFNYIDIHADTSETGRVYYTPDGPAPSVTTILSSIPDQGLLDWRERVGEEEATRLTTEAADIGSKMHDMLEQYLRSGRLITLKEKDDNSKLAYRLYNLIRLRGFKGVSEIWGIETALYFSNLYAGRTDLVGVYKDKPTIIDFKTSNFYRNDEMLKKYKMQISAYSVAHRWMFGDEGKIEQGLLLIAIKPKGKSIGNFQSVLIDRDELDHYTEMWLDLLEQYHK